MKVKEQRTCDKCGELFTPRSSRQHFCRKPIVKICPVCGDEFTTNCSYDERLVCSKIECKNKAASLSPSVMHKKCKKCGEEFTTFVTSQVYCNKVKTVKCVVCSKEYTDVCNSDMHATCGDPHCQAQFVIQKRTQSALQQTRICKWCGKEFHPKDWRDVYCYETHYKTCVICGSQFEFDPRKHNPGESNTCSKECMSKLMSQNHDYEKGMETYKTNMLAKYGVENAMSIPGTKDKIKHTNLEKYGTEWYTQTDEYKERVKQTNLKKYGVEHHLQSPKVIRKRIQTCLNKYGVENVFQSDQIKKQSKQTIKEKYGVNYIIHVKEIRSKIAQSNRCSKLETRICALLDNYNIQYNHHYFIKQGELSHEFDFYLPDYNLLIDADGLYYHSYLDDPDGKRVREDHDEIRLKLVPENCRLKIIVEGNEDRQIKEIVELLESIKGDLSQYDSELFKWCRSIPFPYPNYTEKRMLSDFSSLIKYSNNKYIPQCRMGQSILKNFHRSIYHARVGNYVSPYDGWYDDAKLKQVIRNRLIYKNDVDPSKILAGFNVSRICPCVSTFNPVLTKYLITKYLNEFDTVFDPFSGFSGRLIGTAACNKQYIGQDLNERAVSEANQIIDFLDLDRNRYSVVNKNILDSQGEYQCLLTCPPYNTKEKYNSETIFKTCDEWITECLNRFKCNRYVFVVDQTEEYKEYVVEELQNVSHLTKTSEYVIVI